MSRKPYESLTLIPFIVAETVLEEVYTGQEFSDRIRSLQTVAKVEHARRLMTGERKKAFVEHVDHLCRQAYDADAAWFRACIKSKTSRGRDCLYNIVRHWLSVFVYLP